MMAPPETVAEPPHAREDHLTTETAAEPVARPSRLAAVHPLLFAAYPVLFLWSQNLGETDPRDVVLPLVVLVGIAALATWSLGLVLGDRRRAALIVTPLVLGLTMYGHVATLFGRVHVPGLVQQAGWVALVVVGIVAAFRIGNRRLADVDTALDRLAAILVVIALVVIVPFQATAASRGPLAVVEPQPDTTTAAKRDVYWLVFDRYGSDRAHEILFGIQNDLTPWLREQGFTVLDDSHANYVRTVTSVATTLNMTHLEDAAGLPGPGSVDIGPVREMLQSSLVARQFRTLGYRNYHIGSWWGPSAKDAAADVNLNLAGAGDFVDALVDESAVSPAMKRLNLDPLDDQRVRHAKHNEFGLDALAGLRDEPGPKFVFAHILLPHPPYVFDRDGRFMSAAEEAALPEPERLERQLAYTNLRLREILGALVALPEAQRPIIVLQADEGPWSDAYATTRRTTFDWETAGADAIEAKFGILNAWFVPGGEDLGLYPTMTSINTFPTVFGRYFGLDYELLPDTVYAALSWDRQYDLIDVTDRLPAP
jgi:hypothetical protein